MKILSRYLSANFIPPFFLSCFFFVAFLLTFQLFRITKLVIAKGIGLSLVFELIAHISISFLPMAIPLSILFASIFSLNKLSTDSEFLVMRSLGLSKQQLFFPFFLLALFIAIVSFVLNQSIIPYSKREFKKTVNLLTSKSFLADVKAGRFYTDIPGLTIFAEEVEEEGKILKDVFIHSKSKNEEEKVIFAKKGLLYKENELEGQSSPIYFELYEGNIFKGMVKDGNNEKILFERYRFPVSQHQANLSGEMVTQDSMRSSWELYKIIYQKDSAIKKEDLSPKDFIKTELEFWGRLNTPLTCLIFILLGFSLGVQKSRGRNKNSALLCFLILIFYYTALFSGMSLAKNGLIPSWSAIFVPTILSAIIGVILYRRLDWMA